MTSIPYIIVNRFPYEEPYHTQIALQASNGSYAGLVDFYCAIDDVRAIGTALQAFPSKVPEEYKYSYGSDDPTDNFYRHFVLRAYTVGRVGNCALQFAMDCNMQEPFEGRCRFSIPIEAEQLSRLGRLFSRLAEAHSTWFRWTPTEDEFGEGAFPPGSGPPNLYSRG